MERLNLFAPDVRSNPYPHYANLRRNAPVTQIDPGGIWAVSRYDDVLAVLKNHAVFSSEGMRAMTIQPWLPHNPIADSMILMDPPQHTQLRGLISGAFSSRVIPRIEPLAREVSAAFAARVVDGGEVDVSQEIAATLPAAVIADLLGFDRQLCARFRAWSDDVAAVSPGTPPELRSRIVATVAELESYIRTVIADRRSARRDDLVSDLLDAKVDGKHLDDRELVAFLLLLLIAGFETTSHLLTNSLRVLADHPALIERLRAEPAAIPAFIEEVLRYDPPVHGTARITVADTELAGVRLPRGSFVLALIGSAGRDESKMEAPDSFIIDRKQRVSVPFGHGAHVCLGAALARIEARIALTTLLPRIRGVRVTAEPTWNLVMTVRGPTSCRMRFQAA
jgi:cytochrome P450